MAKAAKIDDVKRPDKVTPTPTSRPVLVTNRPTLKNDPMMTSDDTKDGVEAIPMTHTARVIVPINSDITPDDTPDPTDNAEHETKDNASKQHDAVSAEASHPDPAEVSAVPAEQATPEEMPKQTIEAVLSSGSTRDIGAATNAEEIAAAEAKAKRKEEVEAIIASGKYAVPIDAIQRRRSRIAIVLLVLLAVGLALILLDLIADVGAVHVSSKVPHTHFFSERS